MNFSKKHLHESKSLLQLLSPMLENSSRAEFESLPGQFSNEENDEDEDDYLLDLVDYDFSNKVEGEVLPQLKDFGARGLFYIFCRQYHKKYKTDHKVSINTNHKVHFGLYALPTNLGFYT